MKLPEIRARCDWCYENAPEMAGHPTQNVAWGERTGYWLCEECWGRWRPRTTGPSHPWCTPTT